MKRKIVFIGNSIVNGFPFKRSQCFVSLIRADSGYEVINKGSNGETTLDILSRFDKDVISHSPDIVFIMTGTNDFIYGERSPMEVFLNLLEMKRLSDGANIDTVFISPIPVHAEMASEKWIPTVDYENVNRHMQELTKLMEASGNNFVNLSNYPIECGLYLDGVHPLVEGHRYIADKIIEYLSLEKTK